MSFNDFIIAVSNRLADEPDYDEVLLPQFEALLNHLTQDTPMSNPRKWSDDDIRYYYDHNPNILLRQLARMTGKSIAKLKQILMG